jgi:hypothetical protein
MNKITWIGVGAAALTLAALACGGSGDEAQAGGGQAMSVTAPPAPSAKQPAAPAASGLAAAPASSSNAPTASKGLPCDTDGPVCAGDASQAAQDKMTTDDFGFLFVCQNHVLQSKCLCAMSAAGGCSAGACACAVGDPMPSTVGACVDTTITFISGFFEGDTNFDNGIVIGFANAGGQVTRDQDQAMINSKVGDPVHTCLVTLPSDCPRGDTRGKVYMTTNTRTGESWQQADSEHTCGGA